MRRVMRVEEYRKTMRSVVKTMMINETQRNKIDAVIEKESCLIKEKLCSLVKCSSRKTCR